QLDENVDGALKKAYSTLMRADGKAVAEAITAIVSRAPAASYEAHSFAIELDRQFPGGDVGVLSVFFLNIVHMVPGQCLYLKANTPHAYGSGNIMECMACSDNVTRGGLTPKYKDVEVLSKSLVFESRSASILEPSHVKCGAKCEASTYAPDDIDDFDVMKGFRERSAVKEWLDMLPSYPSLPPAECLHPSGVLERPLAPSEVLTSPEPEDQGNVTSVLCWPVARGTLDILPMSAGLWVSSSFTPQSHPTLPDD
ncbi:hypothetical protein FOZ62_021234, partial [Perkinsus olseni]